MIQEELKKALSIIGWIVFFGIILAVLGWAINYFWLSRIIEICYIILIAMLYGGFVGAFITFALCKFWEDL